MSDLVTVDLPAPADIDRCLAAVSIVYAACGVDDDLVQATGDVRRSGSGSGDDYARLRLLPDGRAVLFGFDGDEAQHAWDAHRDELHLPEVDLVAGAPAWWREAVGEDRATQLPISFLYAYADGVWQRAAYDTEDGFGNVVIPLTDEQAVEAVAEGGEELWLEPDEPTVQAVVAAGAAVTRDQLEALFARALEVDEDMIDEPDLDAAMEVAAQWRDTSPCTSPVL